MLTRDGCAAWRFKHSPYPPLSEALAEQAEFELSAVAGTLVGFRAPAYLGELNAAGYHLHFISDDRGSGGHVLDGTFDAGIVEVQYLRDFAMALPDNGAFDAAPRGALYSVF